MRRQWKVKEGSGRSKKGGGKVAPSAPHHPVILQDGDQPAELLVIGRRGPVAAGRRHPGRRHEPPAQDRAGCCQLRIEVCTRSRALGPSGLGLRLRRGGAAGGISAGGGRKGREAGEEVGCAVGDLPPSARLSFDSRSLSMPIVTPTKGRGRQNGSVSPPAADLLRLQPDGTAVSLQLQ